MAITGHEPVKTEDLRAVASKLGQEILYAGTMGNIGTFNCVGDIEDYESFAIDMVKGSTGKRLVIPSTTKWFNFDGVLSEKTYNCAEITQQDGTFTVQKTSSTNFTIWRFIGIRSGGGAALS